MSYRKKNWNRGYSENYRDNNRSFGNRSNQYNNDYTDWSSNYNCRNQNYSGYTEGGGNSNWPPSYRRNNYSNQMDDNASFSSYDSRRNSENQRDKYRNTKNRNNYRNRYQNKTQDEQKFDEDDFYSSNENSCSYEFTKDNSQPPTSSNLQSNNKCNVVEEKIPSDQTDKRDTSVEKNDVKQKNLPNFLDVSDVKKKDSDNMIILPKDVPLACQPSTSSEKAQSKECNAEQITKKLINQITSMNKYNLKQTINNPNIKYDTVLQTAARKKFREEMRKQLRNICDQDNQNMLEPDECIDSNKIPDAVFEEIERVLDINLLSVDYPIESENIVDNICTSEEDNLNTKSDDFFPQTDKLLLENSDFLTEDRFNENLIPSTLFIRNEEDILNNQLITNNSEKSHLNMNLKDEQQSDNDVKHEWENSEHFEEIVTVENFLSDKSLQNLTSLSFLNEELNNSVINQSANINSISDNFPTNNSESVPVEGNISAMNVTENCLKMINSNDVENVNDIKDKSNTFHSNYKKEALSQKSIGIEPLKRKSEKYKMMLEEDIIKNHQNYPRKILKLSEDKNVVGKSIYQNMECDAIDSDQIKETIEETGKQSNELIQSEIPNSLESTKKKDQENASLAHSSTVKLLPAETSNDIAPKKVDLFTKLKNFDAIKAAALSKKTEKLKNSNLETNKEGSLIKKKKKKSHKKHKNRKKVYKRSSPSSSDNDCSVSSSPNSLFTSNSNQSNLSFNQTQDSCLLVTECVTTEIDINQENNADSGLDNFMTKNDVEKGSEDGNTGNIIIDNETTVEIDTKNENTADKEHQIPVDSIQLQSSLTFNENNENLQLNTEDNNCQKNVLEKCEEMKKINEEQPLRENEQCSKKVVQVENKLNIVENEEKIEEKIEVKKEEKKDEKIEGEKEEKIEGKKEEKIGEKKEEKIERKKEEKIEGKKEEKIEGKIEDKTVESNISKISNKDKVTKIKDTSIHSEKKSSSTSKNVSKKVSSTSHNGINSNDPKLLEKKKKQHLNTNTKKSESDSSNPENGLNKNEKQNVKDVKNEGLKESSRTKQKHKREESPPSSKINLQNKVLMECDHSFEKLPRLWRSPGEKKCIEPITAETLLLPQEEQTDVKVINVNKMKGTLNETHASSSKSKSSHTSRLTTQSKTSSNCNNKHTNKDKPGEHKDLKSKIHSTKISTNNSTQSSDENKNGAKITTNEGTMCTSSHNSHNLLSLSTSSTIEHLPSDNVLLQIQSIDTKLKELCDKRTSIDETILKLQKDIIDLNHQSTQLQIERNSLFNSLLLSFQNSKIGLQRSDSHTSKTNSQSSITVNCNEPSTSSSQSQNEKNTRNKEKHLISPRTKSVEKEVNKKAKSSETSFDKNNEKNNEISKNSHKSEYNKLKKLDLKNPCKRVLGIVDVTDDLSIYIKNNKKTSKTTVTTESSLNPVGKSKDIDVPKVLISDDHKSLEPSENVNDNIIIRDNHGSKRKQSSTNDNAKKLKLSKNVKIIDDKKPQQELSTENLPKNRIESSTDIVDGEEKTLLTESVHHKSVVSKAENVSKNLKRKSKRQPKLRVCLNKLSNNVTASDSTSCDASSKGSNDLLEKYKIKKCTVKLEALKDDYLDLNFRGFVLSPTSTKYFSKERLLSSNNNAESCVSIINEPDSKKPIPLPERILKINKDEEQHVEPENTEQRFVGHKSPIVYFQIINNSLIAASEDGNIYKYNMKNGKLENTFTHHTKTVTSFIVLLEHIYSTSLDGYLKKFHLDNFTDELLSIHVNEPLLVMEYSWDTIFMGSRNGKIFTYSTKEDTLHEDVLCSVGKSIMALKSAKEGPRNVLVISARSSSITVRDALTGLLLRSIEIPHKTTVSTILLDGGVIHCGTNQNTILSYDFTNGNEIAKRTVGSGTICVKMYRNNIMLSGCYDGYIYAYDNVNKKSISRIQGPGKMLLYFDILNENIIASSKDNKLLQLWKIPESITEY